METIKDLVKEKTGRSMQQKATPIREGVFNMNPSTTMEDVKDMCNAIKDEFGINTFQIHLHKDEGHTKDGEWKPNLHGHVVFDWTDHNTGKSIKLNRQDMSKFQDLVADALNMERGVSSEITGRTHLSPIAYKNEVRKNEFLTLQNSSEMANEVIETNFLGNIKKSESTENIEKLAQKYLESKKIIEEQSKQLQNSMIVIANERRKLEEAKNEVDKFKDLSRRMGNHMKIMALLHHDIPLSKQQKELYETKTKQWMSNTASKTLSSRQRYKETLNKNKSVKSDKRTPKQGDVGM
jgi:hypothetical protein